MSATVRFAVGFVIGLLLSGSAFALTGAGHGTYAPMIANASVLVFIPVVGVFIALFGTPFLWGIYFALIPEIDSRTKQIAVVILLVLLHLVPGFWLALDDSAFTRELQFHPVVMISEALFLLLGFVVLTLFCSIGVRRRI